MARKTATYDDFAGVVFAQFLFEPRAAVVTGDFPLSLLSALY